MSVGLYNCSNTASILIGKKNIMAEMSFNKVLKEEARAESKSNKIPKTTTA